MIKTIGAMLLIGSASFIGIKAASGFSLRVNVLNGFLQALDIMRAEIGENLTPIPDLMEMLSKKLQGPVSEFFSGCADEMSKRREAPFRFIWSKNLMKAEYLRLKPSEVEVLSELGNVLGRYSALAQEKVISHSSRALSAFLERAREEKARLGKLYAKLGVICGISIVIVFI